MSRQTEELILYQGG